MLWLGTAVAAAACVFLILVAATRGLIQVGALATLFTAVAGIVAAIATVWALRRRQPKAPLPPELEVPDWVIDRPAEMTRVVKALVDGQAKTVGITTGLYGAGGFGKTTLAQMVCADRRVRRRFAGRVYLVTVGRDVRGAAAIAAKVNDVIKLVAGVDATITDPQLAGQQLGALLDAGSPSLLVLDDVWDTDQLAPFTQGGRGSARLVTTRAPELLAEHGQAVEVGQMSPDQARALLTSGLPQLDPAVAEGLLVATGRWPLLLRLVNKILADYALVAPDVSAQGAVLLERLRTGGPAVVDDVLGDEGRGLDVGQPHQRARAVRATIGASTGLLNRHDAERFTELGIFAEDETIPFNLVAQLWRATGALDELRAARVSSRLAQLALLSRASPGHGITLHDVVRDFLRAKLGKQRTAELNGILLDAIAANLPAASPLDSADLRPVEVAWWELGDGDRYLWDHLIEHLRDAGRPQDAEAVASDLRWVGARVERFGPAAPAADLSAVGTPRAERLRAVLARTAHLLAPTEPAVAVVDVLHSRVATDPVWGPQVTALRDIYRRPRLVNHWPLPDLADPALQRVLTGHTSGVPAVAVAPDGSWLASGSYDSTVRIWDAATGQQRATITDGIDSVHAVAVAPDGSWLASGSYSGRVRIWDVATRQQRATITGHTGSVNAVAAAPDGSWLASGSDDGTVRIWNVATGKRRATLTGRRTNPVKAVAVAPDGSWLASGNDDGTVRIWDIATRKRRATFTGHTGSVNAVAVAPDGSWLASGSRDGTVRIWDVATGQQRATFTGHTGSVNAVAVAPDGSWVASGSGGGGVWIWDVVTGQLRTTLADQMAWVHAVAVAPDGSWLASGSDDATVRIWDVATGQQRALADRTGWVFAVVAAPDGSWLASTSRDDTVQIWDVATGKLRTTLTGHTGSVFVVAPDGNWLASGGRDRTVHIWDMATWHVRAWPSTSPEMRAVALAPDASWLACTSPDNDTVQIWDAATRKLRTTLTGKRWATFTGSRLDLVLVVWAVAPDGTWLASGSYDGTVRIWDVATGQQRATLTGHTGSVNALAVAPDGTWLASGSRHGTVRIWDVATGQQRATLTGHTGSVNTMAVASDGTWLASGGDDKTVRIWDVGVRQTRALMRLDNEIRACTWLNTRALAVGGRAGLYLFDFLPGASTATPSTDNDGGDLK